MLVLDEGVHPDRGVRSHGVVPVDPLCGGELDIVDARPGGLVADELGMGQEVQGSRQGVVVGVSLPHRGHLQAVGERLSVADEAVVDSAVGVVDEAGEISAVPAALPDAHIQTIKGEGGVQACRDLPAHDPTRVRIYDESDVRPLRDRSDVGDVGDPQLIRLPSREVAVRQVRGALLTQCGARRVGRLGPTAPPSA